MNRHSEGALERAREIANREAALLGKVRKPKLTIQVARRSIPSCGAFARVPVHPDDALVGFTCPYDNDEMAAKHPHEIVEHQAAYPPLVAQPGQCEPWSAEAVHRP